MALIDVTAKVSGLHPVSGLYLVEGERYSIEEEEFSDQVFDKLPSEYKQPSEDSPTEEHNPTEGGGA